MAYLNAQAREALARELTTMNFNQAKGKLRRMDADGKLAFLRNAQETGEYLTRFDLYGLGVVVTLIEREPSEDVTTTRAPGSASVRLKPNFVLDEVDVAPMPDNHS